MLLMLVDTLALLGLCLDSDHDMRDPQRMAGSTAERFLPAKATTTQLECFRFEAVLQELWPGAHSTHIPFQTLYAAW